jgi:hypothetical protein
MNILYNIEADQIEDGDQIVVDNDYLENVTVLDGEDINEIIVKGFSEDTGDIAEYALPFDYTVSVWAV